MIGLVKVPQAATVALLVLFHLRYRLRITGVLLIFGAGAVWAAAVGVLRGTWNSDGLVTHVFMTAMPVLAASFGAHFATAPSEQTRPILRRAVWWLFWLSASSILTYSWFHYGTGQIAYFGFDSYLPVAAAWYLADRQGAAYGWSILLVLISGKRAPLLTMFAPLLPLVWRSLMSLRWQRLVSIAGVLVLCVVALTVAARAGLLSRFEGMMAVDITDWESLYLATSGRSHEVGGLVAFFNESPGRWVTGAGFGGAYYMLESGYQEIGSAVPHHYLHLAVFTYLLVFGAPFTVVLLLYLAWLAWRVRQHVDHFYVIGAIVMFTWSLFGAGLIVDPTFWFFVGACTTLPRPRRVRPLRARPAQKGA